MLRAYYRLTKPGIVYGNILTVIAGNLYASHVHVSLSLLAVVVGMMLVIGGACVYNNYLDQDIDVAMLRTRDRALVTGVISGRRALVFATALEVIGAMLLYVFVNPLTCFVALFGVFAYDIVYTIAKRYTHWGTVIGSVSGAVPIVAGYVAFSDRLDVSALVLFLCMVFWQMPHFYAIALYRLDEYRSAAIPVLPARKSFRAVVTHMFLYMIAYMAAAVALWVYGSVGYAYLFIMVAVCAWWLRAVVRGYKAPDHDAWARSVFKMSLIVLLVFSAAVSFLNVVP